MMTEKAEKAGKPLSEAEIAELKDDVLVRANGVPTYFAADIAYHYNKFAERGFRKRVIAAFPRRSRFKIQQIAVVRKFFFQL